MRMLRIGMVLTAAALLLVPVAAQNPQSLDVQLQRAIQKEMVTGDLKAAIAEYERIVARAGANREIAAQALVHMAESYQKLGDEESRKIYERVIREFADQKEAVTMARSRLDGNATAQDGGVVSRKVWTLTCVCDVFGNISPDGRYIAYLDYRGGDLFLHDLRTAANRRLTDGNSYTDGAIPVSLTGVYSFSRDGKQLAYSWFNNKSRRQEIRVIDPRNDRTATFRKLFDNEDVQSILPHDWSPDGKWIAVALHRMDRSGQIGLVSTEDGSLRVLKSVDWVGPSHMFFSPDGKYLAFDLQGDVFILAIDGSREIPAVVHPSVDVMVGWSPDGAHVLFASDRAGSTDLWALHLADSKVQGPPDLIKREVGRSALLGSAHSASMESMGVTTSGTMYSVVYNGRETDIQQATFDFSQGRFLSPPVAAVHTFVGSNSLPNWSPDGNYLAYLSRRKFVGIRSLATGQVRELSLSRSLSYVWGFNWASDAGSFLFEATDDKGRTGIFRIDPATGRADLIVEAVDRLNFGRFFDPAESPDGKFLYYSRRVQGVLPAGPQMQGLQRAIVRRDLASGSEREMIRRDNLSRFVLSPDGRFIATASNDAATKSTSIVLIPTGGGEPRELMRGDPPLDVQMWAPDSQSMFVRKGTELWRAVLDGGQPVKLDVKLDPAMAPFFQVHPDGRQIAIQLNGPIHATEVWALENFLPAPNASR